MTQSSASKSMRRSDATREAMLEAGRRLLLEEPAAGAFSHLTASRVAAMAGRTTGALFHQWPTLDDYLQDLLAQLFDSSQSRTFDEFSSRVTEVVTRGGGRLAEGILSAARDALDVLPQDPHSVAELLAWNRACHDEEFRQNVAALYPQLDRMGAEFIRGLLHLAGREMRPPYTEETFAALCSGVLQGLAIRSVLTPGFYPRDVAGHVLLALIPVFTRPPGDDTEIHELLSGLN
jgi:AcrR family transcriptional regulator